MSDDGVVKSAHSIIRAVHFWSFIILPRFVEEVENGSLGVFLKVFKGLFSFDSVRTDNAFDAFIV